MGIPSGHVGILVHWYVRSLLVVVGTKVTIRRPKPLVKAMLEGMKLWLLSQVPKKTQGVNNEVYTMSHRRSLCNIISRGTNCIQDNLTIRDTRTSWDQPTCKGPVYIIQVFYSLLGGFLGSHFQ